MSLDSEYKIRGWVRQILFEKIGEGGGEEELPMTSGPGPGRFKKELKNMKAAADADPQGLMSRLKISAPTAVGESPHKALEGLVRSALAGTKEMSSVYTGAAPKEDAYGRKGVSITVTGKGMSSRDGLIFIRETMKGARNAGFITFDERVQVELLGGGILVYAASRPFMWNRAKKKSKKSK